MLVTMGENGRSPPLCLLPPSASRCSVGIAPGVLGQLGPPRNTSSQLSPFCSLTHSVFEELELPGAELLHFFCLQGPTAGTSAKEAGRRRFLKKEK